MLIYVVIYCHQLPFYLIRGELLTKFSPIFASFRQKYLDKIFFVALGGVPAPPGYAYASGSVNLLPQPASLTDYVSVPAVLVHVKQNSPFLP